MGMWGLDPSWPLAALAGTGGVSPGRWSPLRGHRRPLLWLGEQPGREWPMTANLKAKLRPVEKYETIMNGKETGFLCLLWQRVQNPTRSLDLR